MSEKIVSQASFPCRGPKGKFWRAIGVVRDIIEYSSSQQQIIVTCPVRVNHLDEQRYCCTTAKNATCPFRDRYITD